MNNLQIAQDVLKLVGGEKNVNTVFHCATRLRFSLKDSSIADVEGLKKTKGVVGVSESGGMFMVIIGQNVTEVYNHLCSLGNFKKENEIDENLDGKLGEKKKFSVKKIVDGIVYYITQTMVPVIPAIIGVALWKTVALLLGPDMLNVVAADSDFYTLCNFLYSVVFYFLPMYLGYSAAKALKTEPVWGIFCGALIIVPEFVAMVGVRDTFSVFGISAPVASYSQTFLPVILGVWILSYVYKFIKKIVPVAVSQLLVPMLTIFVMSIVMFVVCAPIGNYVGNIISSVFIYLNNAAAPIRIAGSIIFCGILPFVLLCGMHVAIYLAVYVAAIPFGYEAFVLPAFVVCSFTYCGLALGAFLKCKKKENKSLNLGYFITCFIGSISEPILYGIVLKNKKNIAITVTCCAAQGLLLGLLQPKAALLGNVNIFALAPYFTVPEFGTGNIILGCAIAAVGFILACVGALMFGEFEEKE